MASALNVFSSLVEKYQREIDGMEDSPERDRFKKMVEDMKSVRDVFAISDREQRRKAAKAYSESRKQDREEEEFPCYPAVK